MATPPPVCDEQTGGFVLCGAMGMKKIDVAAIKAARPDRCLGWARSSRVRDDSHCRAAAWRGSKSQRPALQ